MGSRSRNEIIPLERIQNKIYLIRGQKVMLDVDIAAFYHVETGAMKQKPISPKTRRLGFWWIGIRNNLMRARIYFLVFGILAGMSVCAIVAVDSASFMSTWRHRLLSDFTAQGVIIWWLTLGGPFRTLPTAPVDCIFASLVNGFIWSLMLFIMFRTAVFVRRCIRR